MSNPKHSRSAATAGKRSSARTVSELPTRNPHTTSVTRKCLQTTLAPGAKTPRTRSSFTVSRDVSANSDCKTYVPKFIAPAMRGRIHSARTAASGKKTTRWTPVTKSGPSRPGKTTHWSPVSASRTSASRSRGSASRRRKQSPGYVIALEVEEKRNTSRGCIFWILACLAIIGLLTLGLWFFVFRKSSTVETSPDPIVQNQPPKKQEPIDAPSSDPPVNLDPKPTTKVVHVNAQEPEPGMCSRIWDKLSDPKTLLGCAVGAFALYCIWDNVFGLQQPDDTTVLEPLEDDEKKPDTNKPNEVPPVTNKPNFVDQCKIYMVNQGHNTHLSHSHKRHDDKLGRATLCSQIQNAVKNEGWQWNVNAGELDLKVVGNKGEVEPNPSRPYNLPSNAIRRSTGPDARWRYFNIGKEKCEAQVKLNRDGPVEINNDIRCGTADEWKDWSKAEWRLNFNGWHSPSHRGPKTPKGYEIIHDKTRYYASPSAVKHATNWSEVIGSKNAYMAQRT